MAESIPKEHRTVSRVTSILEAVSAGDSLKLNDLAAVLKAPKSSVYGLVRGLVATGYLVEHAGAYRLGPALGQLLPVTGPDLKALCNPILVALRDEFGETAALCAEVGDSFVYSDKVESRQVIRFSPPYHERRPLYPPSAGKVFLAERSAAARATYLRSVLPSDRDIDRAMEVLESVRRDSVGYNNGETLPDVSAVARPIRQDGRIIAVLAVSGPTTRVAGRFRPIADALQVAVREAESGLAR